MSLKKMKVKNKLILFSIIMIIFIVFSSGVGLIVANLTNKARASRFDTYGQGELELCEAFSNFHEVKVHLRNLLFLYSEDSQERQNTIDMINATVAEGEEHFAAFEQKIGFFDKSIGDNFTICMGYIRKYEAYVSNAIQLVINGDLDQARAELLTTGLQTANEAEDVLRDIISEMEADSIAANDLIEWQVSGLMIAIVVVCIISVVVAFIYCAILIRSITIPMSKLSIAAKKLALGDVNVDCTKQNDDDLGELLDEFANMAVNIKEQAGIAEMISRGDLTVKVNPRGNEDILGKALLKLVTDNNYTLGNISESTKQVTLGAGQVAAASQSLAQGSTEQASALEEVSASMAEIAEHTKTNASEANQANELINSAKDKAVTGNGHMKSMIEAMDEINESSQTISKIIKVIDDIAFQTNILALNAAVEAARAGEHGKGFAVVAEEVRNLAAKSASAASETAEMIESSIASVNNGTALAGEAAEALDEIVNSIDKVVDLISHIAESSNNQATAVSQINTAIGQVSQVVQTNSATSEECAAASEELSSQAAALRNLMSSYTLDTRGRF